MAVNNFNPPSNLHTRYHKISWYVRIASQTPKKSPKKKQFNPPPLVNWFEALPLLSFIGRLIPYFKIFCVSRMRDFFFLHWSYIGLGFVAWYIIQARPCRSCSKAMFIPFTDPGGQVGNPVNLRSKESGEGNGMYFCKLKNYFSVF